MGKTWSPENFTSLINDVESKIFDVLPDDTWFYPGHGDDSTLGAERPHLPDWRARGGAAPYFLNVVGQCRPDEPASSA